LAFCEKISWGKTAEYSSGSGGAEKLATCGVHKMID
jgi:hypothetical protein